MAPKNHEVLMFFCLERVVKQWCNITKCFCTRCSAQCPEQWFIPYNWVLIVTSFDFWHLFSDKQTSNFVGLRPPFKAECTRLVTSNFVTSNSLRWVKDINLINGLAAKKKLWKKLKMCWHLINMLYFIVNIMNKCTSLMSNYWSWFFLLLYLIKCM